MENLERNEAVQVSSERSFGIVFTVVFALIALFPLLHGAPPRLWSLAAAAAFLAAALLRPALLEEQRRSLDRLAAELPAGLSLLVGMAEPVASADLPALHNALALVEGGGWHGVARKRLLPSYDGPPPRPVPGTDGLA